MGAGSASSGSTTSFCSVAAASLRALLVAKSPFYTQTNPKRSWGNKNRQQPLIWQPSESRGSSRGAKPRREEEAHGEIVQLLTGLCSFSTSLGCWEACVRPAGCVFNPRFARVFAATFNYQETFPPRVPAVEGWGLKPDNLLPPCLFYIFFPLPNGCKSDESLQIAFLRETFYL